MVAQWLQRKNTSLSRLLLREDKTGTSPRGMDGLLGNREKLLPTKSGRKYYECDIDTLHAKSRGGKRIVFSNDGLIYYTDDHYETFTKLY